MTTAPGIRDELIDRFLITFVIFSPLERADRLLQQPVMPANSTIESIASFKTRLIVGLAAVIFGMFWSVQNSNDQTIQYALLIGGFVLMAWGLRSVRNPRLVLKYYASQANTVAQLIEQWKPAPARLESEYEQSLHKFLKSRLTFVKVSRQYGTARVKCDIATGNHVMIELKAGFKSTQKLQRLIGQIDLYRREWQKPIIIVLLGETEEDLLHDLNRSIANYSSVRVIVKEVGSAVEDDEKTKAHSA